MNNGLPEGWEWLPELGKEPKRLTPEQAEQLRKASEASAAASEELSKALQEYAAQFPDSPLAAWASPQPSQPAQRYLAIDAKGGRPAEEDADKAGLLASFLPPMNGPITVNYYNRTTGKTTLYVVLPDGRSRDLPALGVFSRN